jgi:hypothetical protein
MNARTAFEVHYTTLQYTNTPFITCQVLSLSLGQRKKHILKVSEQSAVENSRIYKKWKKIHNEMLHDVHYSSNIYNGD